MFYKSVIPRNKHKGSEPIMMKPLDARPSHRKSEPPRMKPVYTRPYHRKCTIFAGTMFEKPDYIEKVVDFKDTHSRYDISARWVGDYVPGSKRDDIFFQITDNNGHGTTAELSEAEVIVKQWTKSALKKGAKLEPPVPRTWKFAL